MDLLDEILESVKSGEIPLDKARKQIMGIFGANSIFTIKQTKIINALLMDVSRESYTSGGGDGVAWVRNCKEIFVHL